MKGPRISRSEACFWRRRGIDYSGGLWDAEGIVVADCPRGFDPGSGACSPMSTPSNQFPLGVALSAGRRRELLAWASKRIELDCRGRV